MSWLIRWFQRTLIWQWWSHRWYRCSISGRDRPVGACLSVCWFSDDVRCVFFGASLSNVLSPICWTLVFLCARVLFCRCFCLLIFVASFWSLLPPPINSNRPPSVNNSLHACPSFLCGFLVSVTITGPEHFSQQISNLPSFYWTIAVSIIARYVLV